MNLKKVIPIVAIIIITSASSFNRTIATYDLLILPKNSIILEVRDGTQSYYLTKLSNVPDYYDISNGEYLGWCIDTRTDLPRSPAKHIVILYSSLNPHELPAGLIDQKWNMVNYILNHKPLGAQARDIQEAIWYFINLNGGYSPKSNVAKMLVAEAEANGANFTPTMGQIAAVVAVPVLVFPSANVQISIIEVTIPIRVYPTPPEASPTPTPNTAPSPSPTPSISPEASPTPTPESQSGSSSGSTNNPTQPQATPTPFLPTPTPAFTPSTSPTPVDQDSSSPTPDNIGGPQGISLYILAVIVILITILTSLLIIQRRKRQK